MTAIKCSDHYTSRLLGLSGHSLPWPGFYDPALDNPLRIRNKKQATVPLPFNPNRFKNTRLYHQRRHKMVALLVTIYLPTGKQQAAACNV